MTEQELTEKVKGIVPGIEDSAKMTFFSGPSAVEVTSTITKGDVKRPIRFVSGSVSPETLKRDTKYFKPHLGITVTEEHLAMGIVDLFALTLTTPFDDVVAKELVWEDYYVYKCRVRDMPTPFEAWADPYYVWRGVEEVYKSLKRESSQNDGTVAKYAKMSPQRRVKWVFDKFTIAKIAPRVTMFRPTVFERSIREHVPEAISLGVYDPCAGFGGRQDGCKRLGIEYEGYDVSPQLISHFGWTYRDVLATKTKTDRAVVTSTPYSKLETWNAGPLSEDTMPDYTQDEWIDKIVANVDAPVYGFFVRETTRPFVVVVGAGDPSKPGLFRADQKLVVIRK